MGRKPVPFLSSTHENFPRQDFRRALESGGGGSVVVALVAAVAAVGVEGGGADEKTE